MTRSILNLRWIPHDAPPEDFPPAELAMHDPDGLLAAGGDLSPERLLYAYERGIFPWFSEGQPILWWSPDPRAVLFPNEFHVSRSLRKSIRKQGFTFTLDEDFRGVIKACSEVPRPGQDGTWITAEMREAYLELHRQGHAHSVEAWRDGQLVGGLYGIAMGRMFFGESMFSRCSDASKAAFLFLVKQLQAWNFTLIDCQLENPHLARLGSRTIPRAEFLDRLRRNKAEFSKETSHTKIPSKWQATVSTQALEDYYPKRSI